MIYYRKTLFGRGPKLTAVQLLLVLAQAYTPIPITIVWYQLLVAAPLYQTIR